MKAKSDENSTTWLTDIKLIELLGVNDFQVSELVLNFDLLPYDIEGNIRHFYEEDPSELVFEIGSLKFKSKKVDEFKKNYPDVGKSEPRSPASYRWRLENELKNIIYLEQNRKRKGLPPSSLLRKEKIRIKEDIKDNEFSTSGQKQKERSRSKVAKSIYIAAASRARIWIQDKLHHDILPNTRQEKLNGLKTDKQFQKIIASLPKPVSDNHLIRMLNEVSPGLWRLGKSTTKKYRKKSMYSS